MSTAISVKLTPQGILIPREELGGLDPQSLEAIRENETIVIRSKVVAPDTRGQIRQLIREAGLLYQPDWLAPPPVSLQEREQLAQRLANDRPLSEIIIEDRKCFAPLTFVSADNQLNDATSTEGLSVDNPNDHP